MRAVILLSLLLTLAARADMDLSDYRWKKRVLIVLAGSAQEPSFRRQTEINRSGQAGFDDRDIVVLAETDPDGPLHHRYSTNLFRVVLLGKDGHTALDRQTPVTSNDLFNLIDSMPMRKEEMHRKH